MQSLMDTILRAGIGRDTMMELLGPFSEWIHPQGISLIEN
jgi:hypothetical protein